MHMTSQQVIQRMQQPKPFCLESRNVLPKGRLQDTCSSAENTPAPASPSIMGKSVKIPISFTIHAFYISFFAMNVQCSRSKICFIHLSFLFSPSYLTRFRILLCLMFDSKRSQIVSVFICKGDIA